LFKEGVGGKRENNGGGKSKIVITYVNITMYPLYIYYMLIIFLNKKD
jgi:hypothetical protein